MKKIQQLSEHRFLRLFFSFICLCFFVGAVCMPDRAQMLSGFWKILTGTCKISTNYFALAGYSATFFNMAVVGLFCIGLCSLPGAKATNVTTLAFLLTVGFGGWGMNLFNMIPTVLGVCLYCAVKKEKLGAQANAMMFSTGIAPLLSELLFRYPHLEAVGFTWGGLGLALLVGLFIGFFLPAGLTHAPNVHKGYDHYSAALPVGMTAFFLRAVLYTVAQNQDTGALSSMAALDVSNWRAVNLFCCAVFALCIVFALLMGCKFADYLSLLKDLGHGVSFTSRYGYAPFLMNVGVFGLFILAYYNLTGGPATGMTLGIIFCMLATCNSGSHPMNVWPIMVGYVLSSGLFSLLYGGEGSFALTLSNQTVMIGLCYANGLSPISGKYGFPAGILAGAMHYLLVTAVPATHGGFLLYNGGFTAALICLMLVPQLERFCKEKANSAQAVKK